LDDRRGGAVYVTVVHTIHDPEKFWGTTEAIENLPEGVALHSVFPNNDGSKAVCLWEADSRQTVQNLVEDTVGDVSSNDYFDVNAENARGLPTRAAG
jgi:hypothetical protein